MSGTDHVPLLSRLRATDMFRAMTAVKPAENNGAAIPREDAAGTNCSTPDPFRITPPTADPATGIRWFALLMVACVALIGWIGVASARQVRQLEETFAEARPTSFLEGLRLREGAELLNGALLRFELSSIGSERDRFREIGRELSSRLDRASHSLLTREERELAVQARAILGDLLRDAEPMLESGIRGIRKDTAARTHEEVRRLTDPLTAIADRLTEAQQRSASDFFSSAHESLGSLRLWLVISWVFLLALLATAAFSTYHALLAPLRDRLSESQRLIERQQRLASLGLLTAGVAHEIRNPLTAIKLRLHSLRRSLPDEFREEEDIAVIHGEISRLDRILRDFLRFAKPSEPILHTVVVEELLRDVSQLLAAEMERKGVRLEVSTANTPAIRADHQQLRQVLINLVKNAAEASPAGGVVMLGARVIAGPMHDVRRRMIVIEVSDTGHGVPLDLGDRIFDPFCSTKEGGTGLGLPIAARIVENHGGLLRYSTRRGKGTTFSVTLPCDPYAPDTIAAR